MLEECAGPQNTCVNSDDEGFDADKEIKTAHVKFEEN